ncbi:MAG: GAF domain-containing protein, partial [Dehalococcoidia bacterium]
MDEERKLGKWRLSIPLLRWVAIILPVLFLAVIDVLRHSVFSKPLHTLPDFFSTHVVIAIAIVIFSYTMFSFISRLQYKITEQNRQLFILNNIAKAAAEKPQLEELLDTSLDQILQTIMVDAGLICLVDQEREEHSAVCSRGFSSDLVRGIQRVKLGSDPVAQEVVRTGRPVVIERVFEDPRVAEAAKREGIESGISAPLKSEGEVNGLLVVATRNERHFSDTDQAFLGAIGAQLGMAIRNAMLYQQSQLQNRELSALLAVGKAVASLDLDQVLSRSLDTIIEVTSTDAAEIWLAEGDEELFMRCHRGAHSEAFLERTKFRVGEGLPGIAAQSQETVVVHDLPSDARFLRQRVAQAGFHTFCALPLRYHSKLVGVLTVAALSADALGEQRKIHLLEGVGERLAVAIENTRLHQQVQDLAVLQERERIAREMHDGLGQLLGYINTQTLAVKKLLSSEQV